MEEVGKTSFPRERRKHKRFELSLALAYQWGWTKGTLRTVDLSLGGIKIQTDGHIPIDERLDLIILFENEAIKPIGKVVRSNRSSNRKYDVGICFETISHQCLKRLERFLRGITQKGGAAKREKTLDKSSVRDFESKSFELDRLKTNFLKWLHKSYPGDHQKYAHRPVIGEIDIWDFLISKGIDKVHIYYLIKYLKGG
ncbi:MAG: PilZ domain-containing protein [Syntrophobacterales bacterium]|nr:MAG: PilZ domain-containing protein [Syntrophobacterales bacterium]